MVVRMAGENRDWGYGRIDGALSNLGHKLGRSTIAEILKRHGIEPASERKRKTTWKEFLAQHWEVLVASDFFTVEVWTRKGLQRFMVLFFLDLSTRRVEIAGMGVGGLLTEFANWRWCCINEGILRRIKSGATVGKAIDPDVVRAQILWQASEAFGLLDGSKQLSGILAG